MPRTSWIRHQCLTILLVAIGVAGGRGQSPPTADPLATSLQPVASDASIPPHRLPDGLISTLDALGATTGVPDGIGGSWYPSRPVSGQPTSLGLVNSFAGATLPLSESGSSTVLLNGSARDLAIQGSAVYPQSRTPFPRQLWDVETGGMFVRELSGGQSWGLGGTFGSASDRPFHSYRELVTSGLAFYRTPTGTNDAWVFYAVSATNGQVGRNIPVPGVAYEFTREQWKGVVGFPFVTLTYQPVSRIAADFYFAPLTDVQAKVSANVTRDLKAFTGFTWANQSWFRAGRSNIDEQLFLYEKRAEVGLKWTPASWVSGTATGGYAFDRYFVENTGFSLSGGNRLAIASGPFFCLQILAEY